MRALTCVIVLVLVLAASSVSQADETLYPPWTSWDHYHLVEGACGWDFGYETGSVSSVTIATNVVAAPPFGTMYGLQECWNVEHPVWQAPETNWYRFTFDYDYDGWVNLSGGGTSEGVYLFDVWFKVKHPDTGTDHWAFSETVFWSVSWPFWWFTSDYSGNRHITSGPVYLEAGETVELRAGIRTIVTLTSWIAAFQSCVAESDGALNYVIVDTAPQGPLYRVSPDPPSTAFGQVARNEQLAYTFNIWNGGIGTLTWTTSTDSEWLSVSPEYAESTGQCVPITVTIDTTDLALGPHGGFINIEYNGGSDLGFIGIEIINLPPSANAGGPYYAEAGEVITFDASESVDIDGTIAGFRWDWENDDSWDTGWLGTPTANHSFSQNGLYRSKLQVKDNDDETSTDICATHVGYAWEKDVLDWGDHTGIDCAIAIDSAGRPHVSYMELDFEQGVWRLKYARWTGTEWLREDIAPSHEGHRATSIALDSNDNPHIAYRGFHDDPHRHLCYASKNGSVWNIQTVDPGYYSAYSCDLAIDDSNRPHIIYNAFLAVGNWHLKYAHWNGSQWVLESVGPTTGYTGTFAAIALDLQGRPHVCCYDEENVRLMYARKIGGSWDVHSDLDSDGGYTADIAVDDSGNPHICYAIGPDSPALGELRWIYSPNGGASWNAAESVDAVPGEYDGIESCSIAVDATDGVHISYRYLVFSPESCSLKYATKLTTQWAVEIVDSRALMDTTLALDAADMPHIAYYATDWRALRYATLAGATNSPPMARANGPYSGDIGETVIFNASESFDIDGTIVGYRWDWNNDGTWDTEWSPLTLASHVFSEGGAHTVVLEVEDDGGSRDTDATTVDVPNDTQPPQVIDHSDGEAIVGEGFVFRAAVTDNVGVAEVWVEYWYDEGGHWSHAMGQVDVDVWERSTTIVEGCNTLHYIIFAEDVAGNPADTGTQDVSIDHRPHLSPYDGWPDGVDPDDGDAETTFTFRVHYYHADGDEPTVAGVIIGETHYAMNGSGADADYERVLLGADVGIGSHSYYFYFEDGDGRSDRLPGSGAWPFVVVPGEPPLVPTNPDPSDGAEGVSTNPVLSVYVDDPDSALLEVAFYGVEPFGIVIGSEAEWGEGQFEGTTTDGSGHLILEEDDSFYGAGDQDLDIPAGGGHIMQSDEDWRDVTVESGAILDTRGHLLRVSGTLLNLGMITDTASGGSGGVGGSAGVRADPVQPSDPPGCPNSEAECTPGQTGQQGEDLAAEAGDGGDGGGGGGGGGGAWRGIIPDTDANGGDAGDGGNGGQGGGYVRIRAFRLDNQAGHIHADGQDGGDGGAAPAGDSTDPGGYENCGAEFFAWGSGTIFNPYRDLAGGGGGGGGGGDGGNGGTVEIDYDELISQGQVLANGGSGGAGGTGGSHGGDCQDGVLIGGHQNGCTGGSGGDGGPNGGGSGGRGAHQAGDESTDGASGSDGEDGAPGTVDLTIHPVGYVSTGCWESDALDAGQLVDWTNAEIVVSDLPPETAATASFAVYEQGAWVWYSDIHDVPDSESLKVKLTLNTANPAVTPSIESVIVSCGRLLCPLTDVPSGSSVECNWDGLEPNTTYYWQVIVSDGGLLTEGPEWAFTTRGTLLGDLDGDCDVDLADLAQLLGNYGMTSGASYEDGDLDEDGDVDLADLAALLAVYGTTCE